MTDSTTPAERKRRRDLANRFWSKVDKTETCWNWTASTMHSGYGQFSYKSKYHSAHRIAYRMAVGAIPDGMFIDHICSNRLCVRPDHLRLVTPKQNNEHLTGAYKNSKSGIRGVAWQKDKNKWRVQIGHNGKVIHVGYFTDYEEAAEAARLKRNELFTHNDTDRQAA